MKKCQCGVSDWQLCQTIYVDVHRGCVAFAHLVDLVAQWQLDLALAGLDNSGLLSGTSQSLPGCVCGVCAPSA